VHGVAVTPAIPAQSFEIGLVVAVVQKGLLALIAADNDVVEEPGSEHAGTTRHDHLWEIATPIVKIVMISKSEPC
jgi:hypothetical protein